MPKYSIVIPVYRNEESIPELFDSLEKFSHELSGELEIIFVNDGSPDLTAFVIQQRARVSDLQVFLIHHTRNFGSFSAIRTGIKISTGDYIAVISADMQEPPNLLLTFFERLENEEIDIIFGVRKERFDPIFSRILSGIYWKLYRTFVNPELPKNGVDVFACRGEVAGVVKSFHEVNTSLVGLLFWVGFKREFQEYERLPRIHGRSAWTFRKKLRYMNDSIFAFSNFPIRLIGILGIFGSLLSFILSLLVTFVYLQGNITVPGYVPIVLSILFGNSTILLSVGIIGSYLWRTYHNSQNRPYAITYSQIERY
jgi:glycosyltransferase involved in cell wall biosynthesis